jgi:hypothetical protein
MNTFIVTSENQVTAVTSAVDGIERQATAAAGDEFTTQAELASLAARWPTSRLVAIWNSLPGVVSVKKFTDRKTAVRRIWDKVQLLDTSTAAEMPDVAPKPRPAAKPRRGEQKAATGRENTKSDQVVSLLKRAKGATLAELMEATGWQPHSVRGFLSGTLGKKRGMNVISTKREDGERTYSLPK